MVLTIKTHIKRVMMCTDYDGLCFVIARFDENLDWVDNVLREFPGSRCVIYNKGSPIARKCEILPNVGRESHTYLKHILEGQCDDVVTVFLQGNPFDHISGSFLEHMCTVLENIIQGSMFENVGTRVITLRESQTPFHKGLESELVQTSLDLFGCRPPSIFTFSAGAMFAVRNKRITQRPRSFYETALGCVDSDINPIRGFCLERLWALIFEN